MESCMKTITLPPSKSVPEQPVNIDVLTSVVVIGANGAGKSRLGAWLEFKGPQAALVHRITAQRSLVFPESSSPISLKTATESFHWAPQPSNWDDATYEREKRNLRRQSRYGGTSSQADTAPLNDFDKLLVLLFSENYTNLLAHESSQAQSDNMIPIPQSRLRKVQALWEILLPHRKLVILSGEIRAKAVGDAGENYPAGAMSDGERVIFYLIGQSLCATQGAIIVIDEPEIHLHKAIQNRLWDEIEKARPDCSFVYLTHDLTFASDRSGAIKVCMSSYTNGEFYWFAVAPQEDIPEDVYLEVLGSRKPVLFIEGTSGSHDFKLYQLAYPQFTVKPLGSCMEVIRATKVFRSLSEMHHVECFGIVDRDYLDIGQIAAYARSYVFMPEVAEVENLYLLPEIVRAVADQLLLDSSAVFENVRVHVLAEFERSLTIHSMAVTRHQVSLGLNRFSSDSATIDEYTSGLHAYLAAIDAGAAYNSALATAQALVQSKDYEGVLRVFNQKNLVDGLGRFFGIRNDMYVQKVEEMAMRGVGNIPAHLLAFLPDMQGKVSSATR
jgi:hypothetical protein